MTDVGFTIGGDNSQFLAAIKESQDAVSQASAAIRSSLQQMSGHFQKATEGVEGIGGALDSIKEKISGAFEFAGLAVAGEAFEKVGEAIEHISAQARQLSTDSQVLGVTVEQMQAMQHAAEEAGVGAETLTRAGERLVTMLNDARAGSSEAVDRLLKLGITTENIHDPLFGINDLLGILRDRLNNAVTSQDTMNALLKELGNRAATAAVAIKGYNGSAESVKEVIDELNGLHEKQVDALKRTGAAYDDLTTKIGNFFKKALVGSGEKFEAPGALSMSNLGSAQLAAQDVAAQSKAPVSAEAGDAAESGAQSEQAAADHAAQEWKILQQQMLEAELGAIKEGIAATKEGTAQRLAAVREYASVAAQLYGKQSPAAQQANEKAIAEQRSYNEQQKQDLQGLSDFAIELDTRVTAEHATLQARQAELTLKSKEEQEKNLQELSDFAIDLDTRVTEEHAKLQQKLAQINQKIRTDFEQKWKGIADSITSSVGGALTGLITHTQTAQQAMQSIFRSLAGSIIQHFLQIGEQWALTQLGNLAVGEATNKAQGMALAGQAGAAGVASFAAAPWPIDIGAPAFGAAMYAEALSYAVAEQGYDVPAGINPLTQLHAREMVLPANLADTVRDMAASGSGGGSQEHHYYNGDVTVNHDEQLRRVLSNTAAQRRLVKTIAAGYRNGAHRR
jgi:hypothetical protein